MATISKSQRRTIQVIDLSTLSSPENNKTNSKDNFSTLFTNLRHILLKRPNNQNEIDSNIIEYVQIISKKIQVLPQLNQPTEVLDILHWLLKIYIDELLSLNNCVKILSNPSFQEIFLSINSTERTYDILSIYASNDSYARTVCNRSFDLLSLPTMIDFLNDKSSNELFSHLSNILRTITSRIQLTKEFIDFESNSLESQIPKIQLLIEYTHRHIESVLVDMILTLDYILNFLWIFTDSTIVVPIMIQAKCDEYILKWISMDNTQHNVQRACLHILHNLARHEQGAEAINRANGIRVLEEFKQRVLKQSQKNETGFYTELHLVYCMVVALLSEPKQNQDDLNNIRKILDQLMQLTIDCGQSINNKCQGFHVSEPVIVLTKLCLHDDILNYVLKESSVYNMKAKSRLGFFCELLMKFRGALVDKDSLDKLTLTGLFNILWSISFHNEFAEELKSNSKILITIKSLASDDNEARVNQYVPKHMSSIPKAAQGILWNLDQQNPVRTFRSETISKEKHSDKPYDDTVSNKTYIMISYSHADAEFCHQLVDALQKDSRLQIWVDFAYCHTDDFWEEIAEAIEKSNVVLFLLSKDYQESKSCRQEVMYTKDSLKKRFIPIYFKKDFVATGWLGVRIVGPQYIRFGKTSFDDTMKNLVKLILDEKKQHGSDPAKPNNLSRPIKNTNNETRPVENNNSKPNREYLSKSIDQWTKQDISQWFRDNSIPKELEDLYGFQYGIDLLLYGQCLQPDWQLEYELISGRYEQKYNIKIYRDQFARFVGAIYRLKPSNSKLCVVS